MRPDEPQYPAPSPETALETRISPDTMLLVKFRHILAESLKRFAHASAERFRRDSRWGWGARSVYNRYRRAARIASALRREKGLRY